MVTQARRGELVLPPGRPVKAPRSGMNGFADGAIRCAYSYTGRVLYEVEYRPGTNAPGYGNTGIWALAALRNPDGTEITSAEWPPPLGPDEPLGVPAAAPGVFADLVTVWRAVARRVVAFFLWGWNGGRT